MKLVYVAGPFSGDIDRNVRAAEEAGRRLAAAFPDAQPVVPHSLGRVLHGVQAEEKAYEGTLSLMSVCHGVLFADRWRESAGAQRECVEALRLGLSVFEERLAYEMPGRFRAWLASGAAGSAAGPASALEPELARSGDGRVLCITELSEEQLLADLEHARTHPEPSPKFTGIIPGYHK